jgi:hypothetical protein
MGCALNRVDPSLLVRDAGCRLIRNSEIALRARPSSLNTGAAEHEMNREGAAALHLHQATSKKKSIETDPEYQVLSQVDG